MKTQIKSLALMACCCIALTTTASETYPLSRDGVSLNLPVKPKSIILIQPENLDYPIFSERKGKVYLNLLNTDRSKVVVFISDCQGRLLYRKVIRNGKRVEEVFNFELADPDRYTIVVRDGKLRYCGNILVN